MLLELEPQPASHIQPPGIPPHTGSPGWKSHRNRKFALLDRKCIILTNRSTILEPKCTCLGLL